MTPNTKRHIRHKVYMAMITAEKRATPFITDAVADDLSREAGLVADRIERAYEGKNFAGALWLAREIDKFLSGIDSVIEY